VKNAMSPTRALLLALPAEFAAIALCVSVAHACGPPAGSGGAMPQGGASQSSAGGEQRGGSWDNAGAEGMRQGADAATRGGIGDDGGGRRASDAGASDGGQHSQDYSSQISALGAAEAANNAAPSDNANTASQSDRTRSSWDAEKGGFKGWWFLLTGDDGKPAAPPEPPPSAAYKNDWRINPDWLKWIDTPYLQREGPQPPQYRPGYEPTVTPTTTASVRG
jgi:hypothetical protein